VSAPIQGIQSELFQYATKGEAPVVPSVPLNRQMGVFNCNAVNNSGVTAMVGIMRLLSPAIVKVYKLVSGVYSELSGPEIHTGAAGDGFAIGFRENISLLGLNISTTATGGDFTIQYSSDGATFGALPAGSQLEAPADFSVGGNNYAVIQSPLDAAMGGPAGLDQGLFYLNVISTGALSGPVEVASLWYGKSLTLWDQVQNGQAASISFDWKRPLILNGGENLIPYFAVPDAANRVSTFYNVNG
jgi:hypothetical protein